jgi:ABC-type transporter Mla subunit MlaD
VQLTSGSNLVPGNDVREGGYRVGIVSDIKPIALKTKAPNLGSEGQVDQPTVGAELVLKLDQKVGKIPADSEVIVRPRSALGLKYVDLVKGRSRTRYIADGGTLPVSQTQIPVQFDEIFKAFDRPTRIAERGNLVAFGDAFAGRGAALNETIASLPRLLTHLTPVARNLAAPQTGLVRFFQALNRASGAVAPVADRNSKLFSDMAQTFGAISQDTRALEDTIAKSPSTLDVSTASLHAQLPFLRDTAAFSSDFNRATAELRGALPDLNPAIELGAPVLKRSLSLNSNLQGALTALNELAQSPGTLVALRGLTGTVTSLNPQLRYLGPYVTVCNYWNYFWTFVAEHFSEPDNNGTSQRALLNTAPPQTNGIGSDAATNPANGQGVLPGQDPQYLHGQPYGAAVDNNGNADCEAVQRGYPSRLAGPTHTNFLIAVEPHTPGDQGPVFKSFDDRNLPPSQRALGTRRVPKGETFTRDPGGTAPVPTNEQ